MSRKICGRRTESNEPGSIRIWGSPMLEKYRSSARVTGAGVAVIAIAFAGVWFGLSSGQTAASGARPLSLTDKFDSGSLDAWQMPYPEDWAILGNKGGRYLHMNRNREPGVPRRPLQYALLKNIKGGSFDLRLKVRREGGSMIVVFNYVDTLHFYYTHLSVDPGTSDGGPAWSFAGGSAA